MGVADFSDKEIVEELREIGVPDWLGSKSGLENWFDRNAGRCDHCGECDFDRE